MVVIDTEGHSCFEIQYTIKISYITGEDLEQDLILMLKSLFKQIKKAANKKYLFYLSLTKMMKKISLSYYCPNFS